MRSGRRTRTMETRRSALRIDCRCRGSRRRGGADMGEVVPLIDRRRAAAMATHPSALPAHPSASRSVRVTVHDAADGAARLRAALAVAAVARHGIPVAVGDGPERTTSIVAEADGLTVLATEASRALLFSDRIVWVTRPMLVTAHDDGSDAYWAGPEVTVDYHLAALVGIVRDGDRLYAVTRQGSFAFPLNEAAAVFEVAERPGA